MKRGGVSEVVGALILMAVGVIAMGIVVLFLVSGSLPGSVPSFSGLISNSSKTVYISHEGGDPIPKGQFQILVDGVDETWNFTKSITGSFSAGKVMNATLPRMAGRVVMIFNTSTGGGTILLSADLGRMRVLRPDWFDCSWNSRKKITVTTGTSGVSGGYSASLTLNHAALVTVGKSMASGNDVRVARLDGTELPRALDPLSSWNSPTTTIWFPLGDAIGASSGDDSYYLYYGNSNAGPPPDDWANVFVWGDDFDDGTLTSDLATSTNGVASISESGGTAFFDLGTANADAAVLAPVDPIPAGKKFAFGHKFNHVSGDTVQPAGCCNPEVKPFGIVQAASRPGVATGTVENARKRVMTFHRGTEAGFPDHDLEAWIFYNDTTVTTYNWDGSTFVAGGEEWMLQPMNTYYIYEMISDGSSWYVRVRDASGNLLTTTTSVPWSSIGNTGENYWFYWGEVYTVAYYADMKSDWVYLRDYVSPEPSTSLGPEEPASC